MCSFSVLLSHFLSMIIPIQLLTFRSPVFSNSIIENAHHFPCYVIYPNYCIQICCFPFIMFSMQWLQWDSPRSTSPLTHTVNSRLTNKYDIHFNFFLTKPVTEMVYNHTAAPPTISFKDAVILADNNQYLKRYYFLKNALDKEEIFDRIRLLAEFYGNAVLLRHEYPLMVLTRTKSIFLKRLKRMKKMLVEEGSSDESKSNREEKAVSVNSSQFLHSVSSSELERKSLDEGNRLQLDFSLFRETEYEVYDIFEEEISKEDSHSSHNQAANRLINLAQTLTHELVLQRDQKEDELKHLLVDFDDFDRQEVVRRYQSMMEKENCKQSSKQSTIRKQDSIIRSNNSKHNLNPNPNPNTRIRQLMEKKPMASSITITALDEHQADLLSPLEQMRKKSVLSPQSPQHPKNTMKRSSYYQYEMDHQPFGSNKQINQMVIAEDELEDSPKHNQKRIKKFPSMDQQDFMLSNHRKIQPLPLPTKRRMAEPHTSRDHLRDRGERGDAYGSPLLKYSSILNEDPNARERTPFNHFEERYSNLPVRPQEYDFKGEKYYQGSGSPRFNNMQQPNRMTSINININNLQEKKEPHRVNVKFNSNSKHKYPLGEDFAEDQRNYRAEKKRKIREKAAALLNRVKSQEYMRTEAFERDYPSHGDPYFERYY